MYLDDLQLFEFTHDLILRVNLSGALTAANQPACDALGYTREELANRPFVEVLDLESIEEYEICIETTRSGVPVHGSNLTLKTIDGQTLRVEASFQLMESESGDCIYLFLRSLTEQQQVRQALRESELRLRTVLAAVPDVLIVMDQHYRYRQVFTASDELLVRPKDELIGRKLTDFLTEEEARLGIEAIDTVIGGQKEPFRSEYTLNINGNEKWFSAFVVPFGSERDPCVLWVARDITGLIEARRKLQEDQQLLRSLLELETIAREVVAYEIHDGFVQYAVGTQMWLQNAAENLEGATDELKSALEISLESINQAVADARSMIRDLQPVIIEEQGLANGLSQLVDVMQKKTDVPISFDCRYSPPRMLKLLEGQFFRIVQESLNNMIKHSKATKATVCLEGDEQTVAVEVVDNGVGFDRNSVSDERYGLEGIQRRASVFGGKATVETAEGKGTKIRVEMPVVLFDPESDTK
ncbi:MAG: PAS domain S-box protein [Planctomycetota bacterium]